MNDPIERRAREALDAIGLEPRQGAETFHRAAVDALTAAGFHVTREVKVRLKGRPESRVDIVLDNHFAIELDRRTPRLKSLLKITTFGQGFVYCRDP